MWVCGGVGEGGWADRENGPKEARDGVSKFESALASTSIPELTHSHPQACEQETRPPERPAGMCAPPNRSDGGGEAAAVDPEKLSHAPGNMAACRELLGV